MKALVKFPKPRLLQVLALLEIPKSTWYRKPVKDPKPRGRRPQPLDPAQVEAIRRICFRGPRWGYKRVAVIARRWIDRQIYGNSLVYRIMKQEGLLQKRRPRPAELRQTMRLFELLPRRPNELWQIDVTYIHLQSEWWYAVTVIDYYSRYLLACYLTPTHNTAAVIQGLTLAQQEAASHYNELPARPRLVTDNGSPFISQKFASHIEDQFDHVRIQFRTPEQLGLLERFHGTLKREEVHWNDYESPSHARACLAAFRERYNGVRPHWALRPAAGQDPLTPSDVYVGRRSTIIPAWQGWAKAALRKLVDAGRVDPENELEKAA